MKIPVIAIGGPHGSGKSSVAKELSKQFGMKYVAAGDVFREMAKENNYTIEEFSKLVMDRPEIDREIDERTKILGEKPNTIVDAQLAAYFTPDNAALKICITASPEVRFQRIADRENRSFEDAKKETEIREQTEKQRFYDLYHINIDDMTAYDIVVNTDRLDFNDTVALTSALIEEALSQIRKEI